jgi:hypothetical protein
MWPSASQSHPIVDSGWWLSYLGDVQVTYLDMHMDDASFTRFVRTLAEDIDSAPDQTRRAVFHDVGHGGSHTAARRKAVADVLHSRRDKLGRITVAYALATPSPLVRGAATAIFWLAPPPYPWRVSATPKQAFQWLASKVPTLDPDALSNRYQALNDQCLARMIDPRVKKGA